MDPNAELYKKPRPHVIGERNDFSTFADTVVQNNNRREKWPHPIPCRIQDGKNKDLFVMTLGDVETLIVDGIFNPVKNEVRLKDGTVIKNYYRDSLKIEYYRPIEKSHFPLPPSGWCSWYYYYQEIDETEVKRNAQWIADNLKEFGAEYIQIDDGWQGIGHGAGENRDWTTVDKRFSSGMDELATYIKKLGLTPGIWLAPHGQSNEKVVRENPGIFLLKPDSTTASNSWEGKFLIDPSTPTAKNYLKNLFSKLSSWGYEYFKIDGQPIVIEEYKNKKSFMKNPIGNTDSLYRETLENIREAIRPNRYLLGCWGIPLQGAGIMNGSRTGDDVLLGWDGFKTALQTTMQYYFLHNIVWYCDPDVMLLRSPLTLSQACAWATLQGLTGQALMASDRMMDLSNERIEILKRVFPAVDIRPMDLFPSKRFKRILDLKVNHLGRNYDVVGVFNFDETKTETFFISWKDLGYPETAIVHVFDFWNKEYLGAWEKGIAVRVVPSSCRVLTLMLSQDHVQLVSTSRHITQGWIDLVASKYNPKRNTYIGKSKVVRSDPYELWFAFPVGKNFMVKKAVAGNLPVRVFNHQGWASVQFVSPKTTEVEWEVSFEPADFYHFPVREPSDVAIERVGISGVDVRWSNQYYLTEGYRVYLNGTFLGYTPTNVFPLRNLNVDSSYTVSVRSVWQDSRASEKEATLRFTLKPLLPNEVFLSELEPLYATADWGTVQMNRSVSGKKISIAGNQFDHGIGTHANSVIDFDVNGLYDNFTAVVGIDDGNGSNKGSVEFFVYGDGKELWRSSVLRKSDGAKHVSVNLKDVQHLVLRVSDGGDGINYDHADWAEAKLSKLHVSNSHGQNK